MRDLDIARWRLRSQHLVSPHAASAREVVGSLLAVQAENPSQAAWAVASRTRDPDQADLATLLDDGAVLRTHVLRPDVALRAGRGHRLAARPDRSPRPAGHRPAAAHRPRPRRARHRPGGRRRHARRWRAGDSSPARSWPTSCASAVSPGSGQLLMILLAHAELDGLICSGGVVDGEHTYALMAERVPNPRRLDRTEALAELALRYFTGHGPATERDLAYWATLTLTDVRAGLQQVRDQLDSFHARRAHLLARPRGRPRRTAGPRRPPPADPRRDVPRLPGLPLGARRRRRRATHPGDRGRDGAGRRTTRRHHAAHHRQRPRAVRPAALPAP